MTDLLKRLEALVGPEHLLAGEPAAVYAVDGEVPEAVVFPGTAEHVSAVLALCREARAAVVPWGGGSSIGLGAPPRRLDVVLGLARLTGVLEHEPADMTSTVRAGTLLADYQRALGKNDQWLALDPFWPDRATIGGLLATNASGPRRCRYGTLRDQLIGLRVAHPDGRVTKAGAKVVKNVTGYDLNKLYVGSLGTLGVIVEATFRLYPLPAAEETWLGLFPALPRAAEAAMRLLDSPVVPAAIELLDPGAAAAVGPSVDVPAGALLAVAVASVPDAVTAQLDAVSHIGQGCGAAAEWRLAGERQDRWWAAVRALGSPAGGMALKASVLPSAVCALLEGARRAADENGLRLCGVSEAASGVIRLHLDPAPEVPPRALAALVARLRDAAAQARGSVVVLAAPREVKELVDVWGPVEGLALMRGLKQAFDPDGILSPGRFVGGL